MGSERDYFGKDASELRNKRLFLLDMDGTIYMQDELYDGTLEFLDRIRISGGRYIFVTNNSSRSVEAYLDKVHAMGIPADAENFFTSTQATILYLLEHYPGSKVFCMGTRSFVRELAGAGIRVTERVEPDVDLILLGFDTELTFAKLWNACDLLRRDIPYIATHPDLVCPVSIGYVPDCGSVCQMLENATGRRPVFIGKPEPTMIDIAREKFGYTREETVVIGDRLYTDIASGVNAGVTTICVLSGEAALKDIEESSEQPTYVFQSVKEIAACLASPGT